MATDDRKNVRISFWNRVNTLLNDGTYAVKFDGLDFDTTIQTTWYEPYILRGGDLPHRIGSRNESWLFQVNCFTKTGPEEETPVSIWDMEGKVRDAFRDVTYSVKDWDAGGNPHSVYMIMQDYSSDPIEDDDEHVMQVACTFAGTINE